MQGGSAEDSKGQLQEHTSTQHTTGHTMSVCTINSNDTFSSWGAQDDTAVIKASMVRVLVAPYVRLNTHFVRSTEQV